MKPAVVLFAASALLALTFTTLATPVSAGNYERCMAKCKLATPHCQKMCIKR